MRCAAWRIAPSLRQGMQWGTEAGCPFNWHRRADDLNDPVSGAGSGEHPQTAVRTR